jgi:hypothetical protein
MAHQVDVLAAMMAVVVRAEAVTGVASVAMMVAGGREASWVVECEEELMEVETMVVEDVVGEEIQAAGMEGQQAAVEMVLVELAAEK